MKVGFEDHVVVRLRSITIIIINNFVDSLVVDVVVHPTVLKWRLWLS